MNAVAEPVDRPAPLRRLAPAAPLAIDDAACLAYRMAGSRCRECVKACPSAALAVTGQALALAGDCLRCGRCQVACPTGALRVAGFAHDPVEAEGPTLRIACWKSPSVGEGTDRVTLRIPCLFGLPPAALIALRARTAARRIEYVDHGWCGSCSAGGADAAEAIRPAAELMRAAGMPEEWQPQALAWPLPEAAMPAAIPDAVGQKKLGRRAFFSGLLRESLVPSVVAGATQRAAPMPAIRSGAPALAARARLMDALRELAGRCGRDFPATLPARLFARLGVGSGCCGHEVCAAHCPTAALVAWRDREAGGLRFDSLACIACGQCVEVCPEAALGLETGVGYQTVTELVRRPLRQCSSCGAVLSAAGEAADAGLCGNCFKSRRLARSAFVQLFGAGA